MREFSEDEKKEIHKRALKRFSTCETYWTPIYQRMESHLEFYGGKQWQDKAVTERENRPTITLDKTSSFINRIVNEQKRVDPEIKIQANYNGTENKNVRLSEILQGYCRYVEHLSTARAIYTKSIENSSIMGIGFMRVCNKYKSANSFDQEFFIEQVELPFSVYLDPSFKALDGSDAEYGFIFDSVEKETYEAEHGKIDGVEFGQFSKSWYPSDDEVTVAEYFERMKEYETILEITDGQSAPISVFESGLSDDEGNVKPEYANYQILRKKKVERTRTYWFKIDGQKVIDTTEFPSKYVPIVPTLGVTLWRDKKKDYVGLIHYLKSPQEMYNYYKSAEIELAGLAPKSPFIAAPGQIDRYKTQWENANTKNYSYLPYDPISVDGTMVPPPQRADNGAQIGQFQAAAQGAFEDMKSAVSIYDAALGSQDAGDSGKAIILKTEQSVSGNLHYLFNLKRSIEQVGKILCDIFQNVVSKQEAFKIMAGDSSVENILNDVSLWKDEDLENMAITVTTGSAYATKRNEEADRIMQLLNILPPEMGGNIADLLIKNLDLESGDEIVKRIQSMMNPKLLQKEGEENGINPEVQGMLEKQNATIQQLQSINVELEKKLQDKFLDVMIKMDIEKLKSATSLAIEEMKANNQILLKNPSQLKNQVMVNDVVTQGVDQVIAEPSMPVSEVPPMNEMPMEQPPMMEPNPEPMIEQDGEPGFR